MSTERAATPKGPDKLLPQHSSLLQNSAISQEVVAARGYRSVTAKAELRRLGFTDRQCRVPTLLIPIHGVTGDVVNYQSRPDTPRIDSGNGKPIKYETVAGSKMALDVPPLVREQLGNPRIPLFITEGSRKADSAGSHGLCCISVLGVWNWRGTNEWGGKTVLPDWEYVALNGREVNIVFDSDVMTKLPVHTALGRLQGFLKLRGANVSFASLPPGKGGEKVGLDDFFSSGNDGAALLALLAPELRDISPDTNDARAPYCVEGGRMCFRKPTKEGPVLVPLCNFEAWIEREIIRDDGA